MWYFSKDCDSDVQLDGKTVVISGATSGIGKEAVRDLYKRGARVLILCRDEQKALQTIKELKSQHTPCNKHQDILYKHLDLSDFSSIRSCAADILRQEQHIHVLINNAGVLCEPQNGRLYDLHFRVNYLGHVLLTLLLMKMLVKSGARIVNVSSASHNCPIYSGALHIKNFYGIKYRLGLVQNYCESKTAQVLFTKELARRLKDADINNITVLCCHPGYTDSPLFRHLDNVLWGVHWLYNTFVSWFMLSPKQAAQTLVYCSVHPELENQSGAYCSFCTVTKPNPFTENQKIAQNLWNETLKEIKMEDFELSKCIQ